MFCHPENEHCECSTEAPCFCMTKYFAKTNDIHQFHKRETIINSQFLITWSLSLGGNEYLLESAFLRAAFEQSIKDYINNDILCSDDLNVKGAEFFGIQIRDNSIGNQRKWTAVSGTGKCKGDVVKCKKPINVEKKQAFADDDDFRRRYLLASENDVFCDVFLSSTIFDAFNERLLTASTFNYNVDVGVIHDLQGSLDLKYDVSFEPASSVGLDQVEKVDADPNEPVPINDICEESQCITQRQVIRQIYQHFELPYDENKHECLFQGINCNTQDMITHIWMGK